MVIKHSGIGITADVIKTKLLDSESLVYGKKKEIERNAEY